MSNLPLMRIARVAKTAKTTVIITILYGSALKNGGNRTYTTLPRKIGDVSIISCCKLRLPATLSSTVVTCAGTTVVFTTSLLFCCLTSLHYWHYVIQVLGVCRLLHFVEPYPTGDSRYLRIGHLVYEPSSHQHSHRPFAR